MKDDEVVKAVEEMKRTGMKMLKDKEWREVKKEKCMYQKTIN